MHFPVVLIYKPCIYNTYKWVIFTNKCNGADYDLRCQATYMVTVETVLLNLFCTSYIQYFFCSHSSQCFYGKIRNKNYIQNYSTTGHVNNPTSQIQRHQKVQSLPSKGRNAKKTTVNSKLKEKEEKRMENVKR